jgi:DNA-binding NarL/FixJ family response regulator
MIVHIEEEVRCSPERTTRMMANSLPLEGPPEHHRPTHAIVMIALADDGSLPKGDLPVGADGYLLACSDPAELLLAITAISSGQRSKAGGIARRVSVHLQPALSHFDKDLLSRREKDVLRAMVAGKSYKMIAAQLGIGFETVRSHFKNLYEKLAVKSNTKAVAKSLRDGLLN